MRPFIRIGIIWSLGVLMIAQVSIAKERLVVGVDALKQEYNVEVVLVILQTP